MAFPEHAGSGAPIVLVDSHCHLDSGRFPQGDLPQVLERAESAGVARMVTVGTDVASSRRCVALAEAHEAVWAAVGVSPNDLAGFGTSALEELEELCRSPRVVAVGEIGLDYHWMRPPIGLQKAAFRRQLELAGRLGLPAVVHDRDAHEDTLAILRDWLPSPPAGGRPRGVLHCFSGDLALALSANQVGFLVSLAGNVTYAGGGPLQDVAAGVAPDMLVLETDSPYLAPQGRRGTRNEPAGVRAVADRVAALRGMDLSRLAMATSVNASRLYGWASWPS